MSTAAKNSSRQRPFLQNYLRFFEAHPYIVCAITALILNSIIEIYSRHSFTDYLSSVFNNPFVFLYSITIITFTLLISMFFRKRIFVYIFISILWLALGIINGTVLLFRVTPLTGVDFSIFWSVLGIIEIYLTPWQIVLVAAAVIATIVLLIVLAVKTPKTKILLKKGLLSIFTVGLALFLATTIGLEAGAISDEFPNLADAYDEYGFAYCFSRSVLDTGIDRPEDYVDTIADIQNHLTDNTQNNNISTTSQPQPNIIFVQLESFFDPTYMCEYELSEDPIPNFRYLKETCAHGYLTVPAVGAGTANTEFEILTGMCLDFFGTCEYPYKTILNNTATCSVCTDLKDNGYTTHAIHNNTGTFYDRDTVYSYLGFDTFTPLEYMSTPEYNDIGWAKDSILTDEIIRALNSTETQDFVFAVSVQAHGKYPREDLPHHISVSGGNDPELTNAAQYYVNQIYEVDLFIGNLIEAFSEYDEPVMIVLYGDHLPSLELENDALTTKDVFKTEYLIWSNFDISAENKDIESWQLSPYIMQILNIDGGPVTTLHSSCGSDNDFFEKLEALEYDLLYGDYKLFNGVNPYTPTAMQMGCVPIIVKDWSADGKNLTVTGKNFTEFSKIYVDGTPQNTIFVSSNILIAEDFSADKNSNVTVAQETKNGIILGWAINE